MRIFTGNLPRAPKALKLPLSSGENKHLSYSQWLVRRERAVRISLIGCGYVGLATGGCLAAIGHRVACMDGDGDRIRTLMAGHIPIYEPHLEEIVFDARSAGRIEFTADLPKTVQQSDAILICVGTPPLDNGEADLSALDPVVRIIATEAHGLKLVIEKSTVPVRTGEQLRRALRTIRNCYSMSSSEGHLTQRCGALFLKERGGCSSFACRKSLGDRGSTFPSLCARRSGVPPP